MYRFTMFTFGVMMLASAFAIVVEESGNCDMSCCRGTWTGDVCGVVDNPDTVLRVRHALHTDGQPYHRCYEDTHHTNGCVCQCADAQGEFTDDNVYNTPASHTNVATDASCPTCCTGFEASWAISQTAPGDGTITTSGSAVRMEFADDQHCGGPSSDRQTMSATATITLDSNTQFDLLWSGVSEATWESMTIKVNGNLIKTFQAQDDGTCAAATCTMCTTLEQTSSINLLAGQNTIEVTADSEDHEFHKDAYYAVRFRKGACTEDCSVCDNIV